MLQVSFVLAALLAVEGVVLAHPINYVRRNEPSSIVPRAVPGDNQAKTFVLEDLYKGIVSDMMENQNPHAKRNWLGIRGYDVDDVETRGLESLETRGFGIEDEGNLERRELMELSARESDGGELDARDFDSNSVALVRRGKKSRKKAAAAAAAAKAAKENEAAAAAAAKAAKTNEAESTESAGDKPTEKDEAGTGTEKDEVANESNKAEAKPSQEVPDTSPKHAIASQRHSRIQAAINFGKTFAGHPLTHEVARGALRLAVAHVFGM